MDPVRVDITQMSNIFELSPRDSDQLIDNILTDLAGEFARELSEEAKNQLHGTRNEYLRGIYTEDINKYNKAVGLRGFLPNAIELGIGPFDEKPGFMKSDKVKFKKDGGWYLTIPYRFATSGAIGESTVFSTPLPTSVQSAVKNKNKAGDTSGLKTSEIPSQYRAPSTRERVVAKDNKVFEAYQHKSSIYEGVTKSNKQNHSQYVSFRRVSDLSDDNSWIHTGIQARNLADAAFTRLEIDKIVGNAIEEFL